MGPLAIGALIKKVMLQRGPAGCLELSTFGGHREPMKKPPGEGRLDGCVGVSEDGVERSAEAAKGWARSHGQIWLDPLKQRSELEGGLDQAAEVGEGVGGT